MEVTKNSIIESFGYKPEGLICELCLRKVKYFDRIRTEETESCVCLSCSYQQNYKPSDDCLYNKQEFDASNEEFRQEMLRISRIDIQRANKDKCEKTLILPESLIDLLYKVCSINRSTLNEEVVSGLGWYATLMLDSKKVADLESDISKGSLPVDLPAQITKISLDDI